MSLTRPPTRAEANGPDRVAVLLKSNIVAISEKSSSAARSVIEGFLRHISPSSVDNGGTMFPTTVRPHALNKERAMKPGSRYDLLMFHVGNAILGYYDYVKNVKTTPTIPPTLKRRIALLEAVAKRGASAFIVDGDDKVGYSLSNPEVDAMLEKDHGLSNGKVGEEPGPIGA